MLRNLLNDESGFLVSAELVLIFTLVFCAVAVGVSTVRDSLVQELGDVAEAVGALDQSYSYRSISAASSVVNVNHSSCAGSGFTDDLDDCDCVGITFGAGTIKNDPSTLGSGG
jgi:Flp pilus assembly pilin Flp